MQIQHHSAHRLVIRHRPWKTWLGCAAMFLWGLGAISGIYGEQGAAIWPIGAVFLVGSIIWFVWRGSILVYDFNKDRGTLRIIRMQVIGKRLSHHQLNELAEVEVKQNRYRGRNWYRVRLVWNSDQFLRLNTDGWNNEGEARNMGRTIAEFVNISYTFTGHSGWFV